MPRDLDSLIPLWHTWEIQSKTPNKRVYEHSERVARIELDMDGDMVTRASLHERRDGEWVQCARVPSREFVNAAQDDHKNALVHHLETSFSLDKDSYQLRESETDDTDDSDDVKESEADDSVVNDKTESKQATFDVIEHLSH